MYHKAKAHFKKADPKLHRAALEHDIADIVASDNLFRDIAWTITGQQLSGKAADTIFGRFEALFPDKAITPEKVVVLTDADMRAAGLSGAKTRAIKNLSETAISGSLDLKKLPSLPDPEVIAELTKVKGIGPWTAEMVLMFSLGRMDIFSSGDLGLQKGIMHIHGLKKLPNEKELRKIAEAWSPYRTYASRVLWRIADAQKARIPRKRPSNKGAKKK